MLKAILTLVLITSCSKVHDIYEDNGILFLKEVQSHINDVKHIEWDVGLKREITVSRGLRFSLSVPVISDSAKKAMYAKHKVDSWVYRFSRTRRGRTEPLGHVFYHFNNINRSTKGFSLNIYYHASSVSKRFYYFHCPAFDHRYHLQNVKLRERQNTKEQGVYLRAMPKIPSKVNRLGFNPLIFSAGRSMMGEYTVDIALYNSKTKQMFSRWMPLTGRVNINQEIRRTVSSCVGIKEENKPLPQSKPLDIRHLEINK